MLRDLVSAVEQSRNQQLARIAKTQHDATALTRWYQANQIAPLLFVNRRGFPNFGCWLLRSVRGRTTLNDIGIVDRAAARCSLSFAASATTAAAATGDVADVEDWSIEAIDRKRITVAIS